MVHVCLPDKYPSGLLRKLVQDLVEFDANDFIAPSWVMDTMVGQRTECTCL